MKNRYYFIFVIFIAISTQLKGQSDMIGYGLTKTLPQANSLNPAMLPDYKFSLGLPGLSGLHFNGGNNFTSLKLITSKDAEGNMPVDEIFGGLRRNNRATGSVNLNVFHLGIRGEQSYTAFSINTRAFARASIPKSLLGLPYYGNASSEFEDGIMDFKRFSVKSMAFTEVALSHGREILGDKMTAGIRLKYLMGHAYADMPGMDASIRTYGNNEFRGDSIDFISNGFNIRAGGVAGALANEEDDITVGDALNNSGFAIDLGATYKFSRKINFFASINDLGFIKWKNNTYNAYIPKTSVTFTGLDLIDLINGDDNALDDQIDSLVDDMEIVETRNESFTTSLTSKLYAGASYQLTDRQTASAILYSELYRGTLIPALTAIYNFQYNTFFNFALSGTLMNGRPNIGTGFTLNLIGLQIYLATNDLLSLTNPVNGRMVDVRTGINFTFGNINKGKSRAKKNSKNTIDTIELGID
ncbi:hypothetical protein JKA74_12290 [Marivirga sp. S37H4]|uniref:DUF5723 domain-containing protein n=1 Tax=Marivirga aurantiaca TaxID=2802615 RepID=A0A934WZ19_9BACT|nr:DUF5723 family protein [Marivirga aurantiaca]MBK6265814.1 hypothetical protein [Marivirga aurantiaca]